MFSGFLRAPLRYCITSGTVHRFPVSLPWRNLPVMECPFLRLSLIECSAQWSNPSDWQIKSKSQALHAVLLKAQGQRPNRCPIPMTFRYKICPFCTGSEEYRTHSFSLGGLRHRCVCRHSGHTFTDPQRTIDATPETRAKSFMYIRLPRIAWSSIRCFLLSRDQGETCPDGYTCLCRPCELLPEIEFSCSLHVSGGLSVRQHAKR